MTALRTACDEVRGGRLDTRVAVEFFCPSCCGWITDIIHRADFHHDLDEPDDRRAEDYRLVLFDVPKFEGSWRRRQVLIKGEEEDVLAARAEFDGLRDKAVRG